jgi:hypothetical protein
MIQSEKKQNYNNRMTIDSVSIVRIHRHKHNIPCASGICIV